MSTASRGVISPPLGPRWAAWGCWSTLSPDGRQGSRLPSSPCCTCRRTARGRCLKSLAGQGNCRRSTPRTTRPPNPSRSTSPPGHHLVVEPGRARLTRGPKGTGHRPAVDALCRPAAALERLLEGARQANLKAAIDSIERGPAGPGGMPRQFALCSRIRQGAHRANAKRQRSSVRSVGRAPSSITAGSARPVCGQSSAAGASAAQSRGIHSVSVVP